MYYASTITSTGQITLPKHIRDILGVNPGQRVIFKTQKDAVTIEREKTAEEVSAEIQTLITAEMRKNWQKNAGKTASEIREEWLKSDEAKEYYAERLRRTL